MGRFKSMGGFPFIRRDLHNKRGMSRQVHSALKQVHARMQMSVNSKKKITR